MICLGLSSEEKSLRVSEYCSRNEIRKTFVLSPEKFQFQPQVPHEQIEYAQIIQYKYFYRLLQEIGNDTLIVVNECLRTQDRYDLTYNCIRNFLNQTSHQLVFQYLPLIDTFDDFMILVDFDTRSRWKPEKWASVPRNELRIDVTERAPEFSPIAIEADSKAKCDYAKEKKKLVAGIGLKDPHTIPRNLYLISGKSKLSLVSSNANYIGRNNRFKIPTLRTYTDVEFPESSTVFEFSHNYINFSDFLTLSRQKHIPALVSDLKVDGWYYQRYLNWSQRIQDAYTTIRV